MALEGWGCFSRRHCGRVRLNQLNYFRFNLARVDCFAGKAATHSRLMYPEIGCLDQATLRAQTWPDHIAMASEGRRAELLADSTLSTPKMDRKSGALHIIQPVLEHFWKLRLGTSARSVKLAPIRVTTWYERL